MAVVDIVFYAVYTASKVGKTGLTPTIDIDRITRSSGAVSSLVTAGSATEIRNGLYLYRLASADLQLYDYTATFKTSDATVDVQHVHALWSSFPAAYATELARLDATITSRPTAAEAADAVWDEVLTGATHNVPTSAGRRLRQLTSDIVFDGLAVSATDNTVTFDGGASTTNGAYDPGLLMVVAGTGMGQCRLILEYNGSTKTAVVDRNWRTNPDATSEILIVSTIGREHVNEGLAQGGGANTITLNANASSANDAYKGQVVFIRSGTGEDQAARVTAYNGTTKVATVSPTWAITPDTTSAYVMLPTALLTQSCYDAIADAVWDEVISGHLTGGTTGAALNTASGNVPPTVGAIADAVWDEALSGHLAAGSTGEALDILNDVGTGNVTVVSPVAEDGDVETYRGDDYLAEDGRSLNWSTSDNATWPDLTGASIAVIIDNVIEFTGSVVAPTGATKQVRLELTRTQTATIRAGTHAFRVVATQADGDVATLVSASWVSRREVSA